VASSLLSLPLGANRPRETAFPNVFAAADQTSRRVDLRAAEVAASGLDESSTGTVVHAEGSAVGSRSPSIAPSLSSLGDSVLSASGAQASMRRKALRKQAQAASSLPPAIRSSGGYTQPGVPRTRGQQEQDRSPQQVIGVDLASAQHRRGSTDRAAAATLPVSPPASAGATAASGVARSPGTVASAAAQPQIAPPPLPSTPMRPGLMKVMDLSGMFGAPSSVFSHDMPAPTPSPMPSGEPGKAAQGLRLDTASAASGSGIVPWYPGMPARGRAGSPTPSVQSVQSAVGSVFSALGQAMGGSVAPQASRAPSHASAAAGASTPPPPMPKRKVMKKQAAAAGGSSPAASSPAASRMDEVNPQPTHAPAGGAALLHLVCPWTDERAPWQASGIVRTHSGDGGMQASAVLPASPPASHGESPTALRSSPGTEDGARSEAGSAARPKRKGMRKAQGGN